MRKVVLGNLPMLLTDTVGFIRKLPKQLMESFKSTLDEVREADILIHVLDISHPNFEDHFRVVNETLAEIDKSEKPTIVVFNKIDALSQQELGELKNYTEGLIQSNKYYTSAIEGKGLDDLCEDIIEYLRDEMSDEKIQ